MANTRPFTDAHAIAWIDFGFAFRSSLDEELHGRVSSAFSDHLLGEDFAASDNHAEDDRDDGLLFSLERHSPDGDLLEALHVHGSFVHLMLFEYRGWEATRDEAMSRLAPIVLLLQDGGPEARQMLGVRDVFLSSEPDQYDIHDVFRANQYLPERVFATGRYWDQTLSFAEDASGAIDGKVFSRLAVEGRLVKAADGDEDGKFDHRTEIFHKQQAAGNDFDDPAVEWSVDLIRNRFDDMIGRNKRIMREMLSEDMAKRIGITEEDA